MLKIACHGGKCCGVKTIHCFSDDFKDGWEPAIEKKTGVGDHMREPDAYGYDVSSKDNFFWLTAPGESTEDRLDRYIDFLKEKRPGGLIEVCLVSDDQSYWIEQVEKRGFKLVAQFTNSNSGNIVNVYHLITIEE